MSYDVFHYYNILQNIINDLDEKKISFDSCKHNLTNTFDELINEIQSFLIYSYDYYYGYFLINLRVHYRLQNDFVAAVTFSPGFPVLLINPLTLGKMSLKSIIYVLCHEIEHLVLAHHIEMLRMNKKSDPNVSKKLNIAFDASVNDRLNITINNGLDFLEAPEGIVTSKTIEDLIHQPVLENQHFLYYYNLLKNSNEEMDLGSNKSFEDFEMPIQFDDDEQANQDNNKQNSNSQNDKNNENNGQNNGGSQQGIKNNMSVYGDPSQLSSSFSGLAPGYNSFDDMSHMIDGDMDEEILEEIYKSFIEKTVSTMSEKSRGLFSGGLNEIIKKINTKPIISWKKELRKFIGNVPNGKKKTIMRLNRRQPNRLDLRGTMTDKTIKLVIAIDTSGSMSSELLAFVLSEINKIVKTKRTDITIIECDAKINSVYKVKRVCDISYNIKGRGGTSFSPVIQYINNNKYYRDSLLIYFTDGYGDFSIPKPLVYRTLWLVFGNYLSVKKCYGSSIFIDDKKMEVIRRVNNEKL